MRSSSLLLVHVIFLVCLAAGCGGAGTSSVPSGETADIVILEKNLFDVEPREIADVEILGTAMDGRFTYGGDF